MAGKIITIEGLDGVGKSTQIDLLTKRLEFVGKPYQYVHFPMLNKGFYGGVIAEFLRGEFGNIDQVHPKLVALLFAEDRNEFKSQLLEWLDKDYLIVLDRYVHSNIAYQCAKTPDHKDKKALKEWILEFEFEHNQLPRPDISFFLNVPFSFVESSLKKQRGGEGRAYLEGKQDIHENSLQLQKAVLEEYLNIIETDERFHEVKCFSEDGHWLAPEIIHESLFSMLEI